MTKLTDFAEVTGLEMIGTSSVWNVHGADLGNLGYKKNSNLNTSLKDLKRQGYNGIVTVYVGCIGRSQHDCTELGIFKGVTNIDDTPQYYTKNIQEFLLSRV